MRLTNQRTVILEEIRKCTHHPTADDLYMQVRRRINRVSLGTVYRNLELFAAEGMIQRLEYGDSQKRFDPNPEPHHHFRCLLCGRVEDIPFHVDIGNLIPEHSWMEGRRILGNRMEFFGHCPDCESRSDNRCG